MGDIRDGFSLMVDSPDPAWLQFNAVEGDGTTNLTVQVGSIMMWVAPNWASASTNQGGAGPGGAARLVEVGSFTEDASYGWWSVYLDSGATNLYFSAQTNSGDGALSTYIAAPLDWASNQWHMVALTYSDTNCALYLDGTLVTNGPGVSVFPGPEVLENGFFIGSASNGADEAHAVFDDIYTYDFPLTAEDVANLYSSFAGAYIINPFNLSAWIESAPFEPTIAPIFNAVTGPGVLRAIRTNASDCLSSSSVWLTNVVAVLTTNGVDVTFTIAGGSNNLAYDVFANSVLTFAPDLNTAWSWMGQGYQCVTYTLTNLPPGAVFLVLGTARDDDNDGLTTAYERLSSLTDPQNPDTSGGGALDGWKVLWGLEPRADATADTAQRVNYGYDAVGWLREVFGAAAESLVADPEGNIGAAGGGQ